MRAAVAGENGGPALPVLQPGCSVGVDILWAWEGRGRGLRVANSQDSCMRGLHHPTSPDVRVFVCRLLWTAVGIGDASCPDVGLGGMWCDISPSVCSRSSCEYFLPKPMMPAVGCAVAELRRAATLAAVPNHRTQAWPRWRCSCKPSWHGEGDTGRLHEAGQRTVSK